MLGAGASGAAVAVSDPRQVSHACVSLFFCIKTFRLLFAIASTIESEKQVGLTHFVIILVSSCNRCNHTFLFDPVVAE